MLSRLSPALLAATVLGISCGDDRPVSEDDEVAALKAAARAELMRDPDGPDPCEREAWYGDGTCDNTFTVTINGVTYTING